MPAAAMVVMSRFELAFRRIIFLVILLTVYLLFGTVLFWVLSHGVSNQQTRLELGRQEKLDFERTELLNILWAESISRSEYDWSLLANQKLDAYEKSLADTLLASQKVGNIAHGYPKMRTFAHAFRHAFLLITTIGGIETDALNGAAKLFSMLYALMGIPLFCMYLDQCVNAVAALLPSGKNVGSLNRARLAAALIGIVGVAVVFDVIEGNDEDTPFLDVVFFVFLAASTIGYGRSGGSELVGRGTRAQRFIASLIFYASCAILIGVLRVALLNIQRRIERIIGGHEFAFTQKLGELERVISGDRLERLPNEHEDNDPTTVSLRDNINEASPPPPPSNYGSILASRKNSATRKNSAGSRPYSGGVTLASEDDYREYGNRDEHVHFKLNDGAEKQSASVNENAKNDHNTNTTFYTFNTVLEDDEEAEEPNGGED